MKTQNTKLTNWEWLALNGVYNLADGHAHQNQNKDQLKIIRKLSSIYLTAEDITQEDIQDQFAASFFGLAGQKSFRSLSEPFYYPSSSIAIEVAANFLRITKKSVALIHPTFDNLADILKRHKVKPYPLEEDLLLNTFHEARAATADAIFLVCPNNPTGFELSKEKFKKVVAFCKRKKKLLIIDFAFRFFSSYTNWDQYKILKESEIDFIAIEDTGKTWPTLDLKLGIIVSSETIHKDLRTITEDFLLSVSPFIFRILTEYLSIEKKLNKGTSARAIVEKNRKFLRKNITGSPLSLVNPSSCISVEWLGLPKGWDSSNLCRWLAQNQIYILPGKPFFWDDAQRGRSHVRIALMRPTDFFEKAVSKLCQKVLEYERSFHD